MRFLSCGIIGLGVLLVSACTQHQQQQEESTSVAIVNNEAISRVDFERELSHEAQGMEQGAPRSPEQIAPFKQALLDTMIERIVLRQAAAAAGIAVTNDDVDRRVLALASEYPAGSFDDMLTQTQTSRVEFNRRTRDRLLIERLLQTQVFARIAVTEDQIRRYFDEHVDSFTEPEMVHAQQIVVKEPDEAKRIQQALWQGKKFADLARRFSLSPDAKVGGDLGFFKQGDMPPAFDEVVFKLSVGQTSDVVTTEYGFHLFKVLEKKPAKKRELAEVRDVIERKLVDELRVQKQKEFVAALRAKADVKVNDALFSQATVRLSTHEPDGER